MKISLENNWETEPPPLKQAAHGSAAGENPYAAAYFHNMKEAKIPRKLNGLRHTIEWPFNDAAMKDPSTQVLSYYEKLQPEITITTNPETPSIIRSPFDALLVATDKQSNGLYTIVLSSKHTPLTLRLSYIHDVTTRFHALQEGESVSPSELRHVNQREAIGSLQPPHTQLHLQMSYSSKVPARWLRGEYPVNPLPLLHRLY